MILKVIDCHCDVLLICYFFPFWFWSLMFTEFLPYFIYLFIFLDKWSFALLGTDKVSIGYSHPAPPKCPSVWIMVSRCLIHLLKYFCLSTLHQGSLLQCELCFHNLIFMLTSILSTTIMVVARNGMTMVTCLQESVWKECWPRPTAARASPKGTENWWGKVADCFYL